MTNKLLHSILVQVGVITLISLSVIGYLWINSEYEALHNANRVYTEQFLSKQKEYLRAQVLQVRERLTKARKKAEAEQSARLQERVHSAHHIASELYQKYQHHLPETEIQQKILDALRYNTWRNGNGYYYIISMDGTELLFPPDPLVENRPTSDAFGKNYHGTFERIQRLAEQKQEGALNYQWPNPSTKRVETKFGYIKHFAPYNWIIGSGEYSSDIKQQLHAPIYRAIASLTFGLDQQGYFFINTYQGDLLVTNNQYFADPPNILDKTDANQTMVVKENIRLAQRYPDGAFNIYSWHRNDGAIAEKISFVIGLPEWQIFIGAGVYLDSIDKEIAARTEQLATTLKERAVKVLGIMFLGLMITILTMYLISTKLRRNFELFRNSFADAALSHQHIDQGSLFFAEFRELAQHANSMIDNLNQQADELKHRAYHDPLTDLPNRLHSSSHLTEMIAHAQNNQRKLALLFIDLDNFKEVNDSLGHSYGDELLQQVAERLRSAVGTNGKVARLGGDEFTVITNLIDNETDVKALASKVLKLFEQPFQLNEAQSFVTASVGISFYPNDGDNAELLLRNADSAMYQAKASGKNNFSIYTQEMTETLVSRVVIVEELRQAIEEQQFQLFYQPQINTMTGEIIGVEALIRWQHPQRGLVSPDQFIPYAESSGQIVAIGEWVIRTACQTIVRWQQQGIGVHHVAVNVSNAQLQDETLSGKVAQILQETGCKPQWLELEITESMLMDEPSQAISYLHSLNALGVKISVDDFGTGYSSLSYLKTLPVNTLKIDRSFIDNLQSDESDQAISRAIIALGHSLNLRIIAEGVESIQQLDFLRQHHCDFSQGYYISKPLPEPKLLTFMQHMTDIVIESAEFEEDDLVLEIADSDIS